MTDDRPNPDQLLAQVTEQEKKQKRGRLKVFFGAAAGVGKTFAMLEEGRARAAEGLDVVVGYAEAHARPETEALLLGMEILPYNVVEYKNAKLKEFDLDAVLKRRPTLVLVDELAHTNAPGLRHQKRWQDVVELLDAGINVYTTLNVQHLESINDVVERITGVIVRETLPDSVLEQADEVELIDTAPDELLERFREGKIYLPEQAARAGKHFFTKGNLIALREMALRRTAERVDAQMQDFRKENLVRPTWAASERILVCVGPSPMSARLIRAAKRMATGFRAPWLAVYVETPAASRFSEQDRQRLEKNLRLAEQLGAETVTLSGQRLSEEIVAYARSRNVTKIVMGKPDRTRWRDLLHGTNVDDLIRRSGEIDIYVIRGDSASEEPSQQAVRPAQPWAWREYLWSILLLGAVTLIGKFLFLRIGVVTENVLMLYLLVVLWVSTRFSRGAAVMTSLLGVLLFDFCFVPPFYSFTVNDEQYLLTFFIMLIAALVISTLTHRVRDQAKAARNRERRTGVLFALSRELGTVRSSDEIALTTCRHLSDALSARSAVYLPDAEGHLQLSAPRQVGAIPDADQKEQGVAQWTFDHDQPAGAGTGTLPSAAGVYFPIKGARGTVGVIGIFQTAKDASLDSEQRQLMEAMASQVALALERASLAKEARDAWERVEAEFLRNTLLSGVSHELRTPLAAITGSVSTLIETGEHLSAQSRAEMLDTIYGESERMERLINNLLDMTRLESGGLVVKKEWQPLQEVVGTALRHLDRRLHDRTVRADLPDDLPLVQLDGVAIEQVLINLIDNAVEYTPADAPIDIIARATDGEIKVEVADRGPGLPPGTEQRVFEKFFRVHSPGQNRRGIGLGLAICRGIVEAHGGKIRAGSRPGGGTVFCFTLPITEAAPRIDSSA